MTDFQPLSDHTDEIEKAYFESGESYQQIADRYGKSREAVRQFLNRKFPEKRAEMSGREFRSEIRSIERAEAEARELEERKAAAPPCVVCGDPVIRRIGSHGEHRTCSTKHADLWAKARFLLDPELKQRQRVSMAKSILKYPDRNTKGSIRWAEKILAGDEVASRTYVRKDSEARRAYNEVIRIRTKKGHQ